MHLCDQLCLSEQPASQPFGGPCLSFSASVLHGRNYYFGLNVQTFLPNSFIPAILFSVIDFYNFIPISLGLILAES